VSKCGLVITLCASCGAVYCNRSCLWVGWCVCGSVTMISPVTMIMLVDATSLQAEVHLLMMPQTPDSHFEDEKEAVRRNSLPAGTASQSEVQPGASTRSPWKLQSRPRHAYDWLQVEPRLRRPPMVCQQIPALAGICGCTIRGSNTGGSTPKSAGRKPTHLYQEVWRSRVT